MKERQAFSPQLSILADSRRKGSGFLKEGMCKDFHSRHSLSAGGPPSTLRLRGLPWPRFSRRSLVPSVPINWTSFLGNIVGKLALLSIRLQSGGSINFSAKGVSDCSPRTKILESKHDYLSYFLLVYKLIFHY